MRASYTTEQHVCVCITRQWIQAHVIHASQCERFLKQQVFKIFLVNKTHFLWMDQAHTEKEYWQYMRRRGSNSQSTQEEVDNILKTGIV